jgi:hypothetical protein
MLGNILAIFILKHHIIISRKAKEEKVIWKFIQFKSA